MHADLIGRKAKVKAVDNRIAQDAPALSLMLESGNSDWLQGFCCILLGSRNGEDRGVVEQEVIAACLAPGLDRNTITATLSDLARTTACISIMLDDAIGLKLNRI